MPEPLTEQIDIWTSANIKKSTVGRGTSKKQEAYGVKKLRELILELAVRGKLVPQNPNDEPASELLKKIAKEKLTKVGKIYKQVAWPEVKEVEKPFRVPRNWQLVRLDELGSIFNGNSINERTKEEKYSRKQVGLPFIATKDVGYGYQDLDYENGIIIPIDEPKFIVAHKKSILICAEGGSAGKKCGITNHDICFGNKLFALEPYHSEIEPRFILANYLTPTFYKQFAKGMTGIIGGIAASKFKSLVIPLPPFAEQKRILAKVDELMALCDQLEQEQENNLETHQALVSTLLNALTSVKDNQEFQITWQRIADCFDLLFTTEESIDQLKQTILQLAVMGKLVTQDPNDEPASELLKKIQKEKECLIKSGKIRKQEKLPNILTEVIPFQTPKNWAWIHLNDYGVWQSGSTPSRTVHSYYGGSIPWVKSGEVKQGRIRETSETITTEALETCSLSLNPIGSVLIAMYGANIGEVGILEIEAATNQAVCACKPFSGIDNNFLLTLLTGMRRNFISQGAGAAQPNISREKIISTIAPLPPRNEQKRIVAKVDELMALCDRLKENIQQSETIKTHLADAIVEKAVSVEGV